jgi:2-isopropylmalate synthase
LFEAQFICDQAPNRLGAYRISRNGHDQIEAIIVSGGKERRISGEGNGAIAAFANAWSQAFGQTIDVRDYREHAIAAGTDAEAAAYVQLALDGQPVAGVAIDRDTVSASLKAVISALNRAVSLSDHAQARKAA